MEFSIFQLLPLVIRIFQLKISILITFQICYIVRFPFARLERPDRSNSSNGKQSVQRYRECSHRKI